MFNGYEHRSLSKTFKTKEEAEAWYNRTVSELKAEGFFIFDEDHPSNDEDSLFDSFDIELCGVFEEGDFWTATIEADREDDVTTQID